MAGQKRIFAILGIICGLIFVQACGRNFKPQTSCNFVQNQDQQRVAWDKMQNLPIDLYLDSSVPQAYDAAIQAAIDRWNDVGQQLEGHNFFRLNAGNPGSNTPTQDTYNKIYVMNTWDANKPNEQARTTVYWTGSFIYEADIRINHKDFDFYLTDTPDFTKVHLESLVIHELGHVLGLAHNQDIDSVMQPSLANGKERNVIKQADLSSLKCEY